MCWSWTAPEFVVQGSTCLPAGCLLPKQTAVGCLSAAVLSASPFAAAGSPSGLGWRCVCVEKLVLALLGKLVRLLCRDHCLQRCAKQKSDEPLRKNKKKQTTGNVHKLSSSIPGIKNSQVRHFGKGK